MDPFLFAKSATSRSALASMPRIQPQGDTRYATQGRNYAGGELTFPARVIHFPTRVTPDQLSRYPPLHYLRNRHRTDLEWHIPVLAPPSILLRTSLFSSRHYSPVFDPYAAYIEQNDWIAAQETIRERTRRARIPEWREADARAHDLLLSLLTDTQKEQYKAERAFEVRGSATGRRYRISYGTVQNVFYLDLRGHEVLRYCIAPYDLVPVEDVLVGQKLMLEHEEAYFRLTAIPVLSTYPVLFNFDLSKLYA